MKKEWLKPQVKNLAVESTREILDCESENGGEKRFWPHKHVCKYCNENFEHGFGSHNRWEQHESVCEKNPSFGIAGDMTTSYPVPTFS